MSFRRMTRMISFRVSEQEFEQLKSKCESLEARSISDYARVAVCAAVNQANGNGGSDIHNLRDGIQQLSLEVRRLFELLERSREVPPERLQFSSSQSEKVENA